EREDERLGQVEVRKERDGLFHVPASGRAGARDRDLAAVDVAGGERTGIDEEENRAARLDRREGIGTRTRGADDDGGHRIRRLGAVSPRIRGTHGTGVDTHTTD